MHSHRARQSGATRTTSFFVGIVGALCALGPSYASTTQPLPPVAVTGDPVAPPPKDPSGVLLQGTGLCGAFRLGSAGEVNQLLPTRPAGFPGSGLSSLADGINTFIDNPAMTDPAPLAQTLSQAVDLASAQTGVATGADGDFTNTSGCARPAGCAFPGSGTNLSGTTYPLFASRLRGFLLVPEGLQNQKLHIGFRAKNVVAMRIFEKAAPGQTAKMYEVVSRALDTAGEQGDYRVTQQVSFAKAGLYPVEILHAASGGPALLEVAFLTQMPGFIDIDGDTTATSSLLARQPPFVLQSIAPSLGQFFETSQGGLAPSDNPMNANYDPTKCQQCPRQYANLPSQPLNGTICPTGMFCNEAAVCSPLLGDQFCGTGPNPTVACTDPTPVCGPDPKSSGKYYTCVACRDSSECQNGQTCADQTCLDTCRCCADAPFCVATDQARPTVRNCSACRTDSDCPNGGKCDLINGRCVDSPPVNSSDTSCGPDAVNCPVSTSSARPYCLNSQVCVQCRYDADCAHGTYCSGGSCMPCTSDRHCGPNCQDCGADVGVDQNGMPALTAKGLRPHCLAFGAQVSTAACVGCIEDSDCGPDAMADMSGAPGDMGTNQFCNSDHTCVNAFLCGMSCPPNQVCNGRGCVECMTASQCPCGQCVDYKCTTQCGDPSDCRSTQCCDSNAGQCYDGVCKPSGGSGCSSCSVGSAQSSSSSAPPESRGWLWGTLGALAIILALRLRALRSVGQSSGR